MEDGRCTGNADKASKLETGGEQKGEEGEKRSWPVQWENGGMGQDQIISSIRQAQAPTRSQWG